LLRGRLTLLTRKELQFQARLAIARESLLTRTPPPPNTVAVMPFRYTGRDSTLRPLERGLAALMVTDLGRVRRLRLVEREQIQALLDELKLAESGRVDPATGARSGRLVGAAQVVQGSFTEVPTASFRVDATMVNTTDAAIAAAASGADQLRALFDIEKAVVFQLLDRMGITLTPAERTAISERPTRDIQAFLLYSRGLEQQDRGDFGAASQSFQAAVQRDPGFSAAQQSATFSQNAEAASETTPVEVATAAAGGVVEAGTGSSGSGTGPTPPPPGPTTGTLVSALENVVPSGVTTITVAGLGGTTTPPTNPNPSCEGAGCNVPTPTLIGTIIIIIKRP
jgi:TolB-like protein